MGLPASATVTARSSSMWAVQRGVQLLEAAAAQVVIGGPDGVVEGAPGRGDGRLHVGGGAVGGITQHLLGGGVDVGEGPPELASTSLPSMSRRGSPRTRAGFGHGFSPPPAGAGCMRSWRSLVFNTLPLGSRGSSSTNSMLRGSLKSARRPASRLVSSSASAKRGGVARPRRAPSGPCARRAARTPPRRPRRASSRAPPRPRPGRC